MNEYGQGFFGYSAAEITGRPVPGTFVSGTTVNRRELRRMMGGIDGDPGLV